MPPHPAPPRFSEQAHVFGAAPLVGVMTLPEQPPQAAVIVIVGGPQYRAGSHRQFVLLCRALALQGHAAFRFDYTGMGDSPGGLNTFLSAGGDIGEAVGLVTRQLPSVKRIALWGLCDGASAALLYWLDTRDPRIGGLCLLNPWVRSAASHAQTQVKHYYTRRLMQAAFWRKLLTGQVAAGALTELWRNVRAMGRRGGGPRPNQGDAAAVAGPEAPFQARMAAAWRHYPGKILLLLSGDDYTAKEFLETLRTDPAWREALKRPAVEDHQLESADHTFSETSSRQSVERLTCAWLASDPPAR
jgi:exosortase A-associated hydrolase 1